MSTCHFPQALAGRRHGEPLAEEASELLRGIPESWLVYDGKSHWMMAWGSPRKAAETMFGFSGWAGEMRRPIELDFETEEVPWVDQKMEVLPQLSHERYERLLSVSKD